MGILTLPIMLAGLVALPILAGIYLLQTRYRRRVVSSHIIWQQLTAVKSGGQRVEHFQPPWLILLLELLILAGLVLAAAGPRATASTVRVPIAVVLDDSFAMQAGTDQSVRERAIDALTEQLQPGRHRVRLLAAGLEPRVLGDVIERHDQLQSALADWQPTAPRADLDAAIARASEMVGETGRVMVVTHRPPDDETALEGGRIRWAAFGEADPNLAIINAWRHSDRPANSTDTENDTADGNAAENGGGGVLEVGNFGTRAAEAVLRIEQEGVAAQRIGITLEAGETRRIRTRLTPDQPAHIQLEQEDALVLDNEAVLLENRPLRVRVAVAIEDDTSTGERLVRAIRRALESTGRVRFVAAAEAELLITDASPEAAASNAERHVFRIVRGRGETGVLAGPYAIDTTHPLTQGLALSGVLWSVNRPSDDAESQDETQAGGQRDVPGQAIVMVGNEALLSVAERATGGRTVSLRWRGEGSNLLSAPDWVILLDNLVRWRQEARPGARPTNAAVGQGVTVRLPRGVDVLELTTPAGESRTVNAPTGEAAVMMDQPGVWSYIAGGEEGDRLEGRLAVNASSRTASDLRNSATGTWGDWQEVQTLGQTYRDIGWAFVLVVTGLLLWHGWLLRRQGSAV